MNSMQAGAAQRATAVLAMMLVVVCTTTARADVFSNVPEAVADGYQLVYTLPIENTASYNFSGAVPYSVDNSASITSPFDRIAYYLELDDGNGLQYAYASMNAFTSNVSQIGLPIANTGANFQRTISRMNVFSNSSRVTTGTDIATGNIEFWHDNYNTSNAAGIPGASGSVFDFGDGQFGNGNYGSFQVHNFGAGETIFAYNQWGGEGGHPASDLGIGNAASGHPDWTFSYAAPNYTVKNLQVLIRPSDLSIDSSLERAVFQRNAQNRASVPLTGSVVSGISSIEARAIPRAGSPGRATDWQVIDTSPSGGSFAGSMTLDSGWYDIEVRSLDGSTVVSQRTVERVGVGEVFVIAGQSNSANYGNPTLSAADDRVSTFNLSNWRHADDPQPIATGSGGSPWPALGDSLAAELDVPVGFISVGWGGTRVDQWVPDASGPSPEPLYNRLQDALQALGPDGARAVLWHQGEADNEANTSTADYVQRLEAIVAQSRTDAGYDIPWGVAQASFLPYLNPTTDPNIIAAQQQVAANDPLNFVGAFTDDMIGAAWRWDNIHFNEMGLREHAQRWFDQLLATFDFAEATLFGDFSGDLQLTCADVDALVAEIASGGMDLTFDLTGDTAVNAADLELWLSTAGILNVGGGYLPGDANLDGVVDGEDFEVWKMHKFTGQSAWCASDFNADGFVDGRDLLIWNGNKGSSSRPARVPEPVGTGSLLLLAAVLAMQSKRLTPS